MPLSAEQRLAAVARQTLSVKVATASHGRVLLGATSTDPVNRDNNDLALHVFGDGASFKLHELVSDWCRGFLDPTCDVDLLHWTKEFRRRHGLPETW